MFGWLVWFSCGRRKCLICKEPETRLGKQYGCNTVGCVYIHCKQCWEDVGYCYACSDLFKKEVGDDDTYKDLNYIDTGYSE